RVAVHEGGGGTLDLRVGRLGGAGAGRGEQASDVLDVTLVAPNVVVVPPAGAAEVHAAVGVVLIAVRGEDGLKGSRLGVLGGRGGRLGAASGPVRRGPCAVLAGVIPANQVRAGSEASILPVEDGAGVVGDRGWGTAGLGVAV